MKCRQAEHRLFLVALVDRIIASNLAFEAGMRPRNRHAGAVGLSVLKDYWGIGIGGALLDALISWAHQIGTIRKINLRVRTVNQRALALYRSKGFSIEGTIKREFFVSGQFYDSHWMGLVL